MRRVRADQTTRPLLTSVRTESRWIGENGPTMRMVWMKKDVIDVMTISASHTRPSTLCSRVPLRPNSIQAPSTAAGTTVRT